MTFDNMNYPELAQYALSTDPTGSLRPKDSNATQRSQLTTFYFRSPRMHSALFTRVLIYLESNHFCLDFYFRETK